MNITATAVHDYLESTTLEDIDTGFLAYIANLSETARVAPAVARSVVRELSDQRSNLKRSCLKPPQCRLMGERPLNEDVRNRKEEYRSDEDLAQNLVQSAI